MLTRIAGCVLAVLILCGPAYGTVAEVPARDEYTGNGSTVNFTYNFAITDEKHVDVYLNGVLQILTTQYTVSGVGGSSGTITFITAPASGADITILRDQPLEQQSDYVLNEAFPSDRVEKDLDKLAMAGQMLNERLERTFHVGIESTLSGTQVEMPTSGCNNDFLKWNATTTGIECTAGIVSTGTLTDPVPPANGGTGLDNATGTTFAGLPSAGSGGRIGRVTDEAIMPVWFDDGTSWLGFAMLDASEDLQFQSGTDFAGKFSHGITASRTWTLPDASTTLAGLSLSQTFSGANTFSDVQTFQKTPAYTVAPLDLTKIVFLSDDFLANDGGNLNWLASTTGSGAVGTANAEAGHPGLHSVSTGTTSGSNASYLLGGGNFESVIPSDTFDLKFHVKLINVGAPMHIVIGMTESTTVAASDGVYFEKQFADTNWFAVTENSTTTTRTDMGSAPASSTWYTLRIRRKDASTISFSIDGGSETDITTNIPTAGIAPVLAVKSNSTVVETIVVDYFSLLITGLSR